MKLKIIFALCMLVPVLSWSEAPAVPLEFEFAGMKLKLTERARQKIQADVNALTRSPKHFQIKVNRANLYFPIIERVFKKEGLPDDFKYLVLQESALISDAVSSSNAVGYWQFKKGTALEVGLRVDQNVDERLNIVSSSRGAALYMKKNNRLYFDNWVYALLAYQQGPGGAQKLTKGKFNGARSMTISAKTHWYVMKFFAHKIAFETAVGKGNAGPVQLFEYRDGSNKTLKQIAGEVNGDFKEIQDYNKLLRRGKVPVDKDYTVIVPVKEGQKRLIAKALSSKQVTKESRTNRITVSQSKQNKYPIIEGGSNRKKESQLVKVNGLPGIMAGEQQDMIDLARRSGISVRQLMHFNDLTKRPKVQAGDFFYLKPKRSKAKEHHHVVQAGEDMWSISQRYGVKLNKLKQKNRMTRTGPLKPGRVLWLRFIRPQEESITYQPVDPSPEPVLSETTSKSPDPVAKTQPKPVNQDTIRHDQITQNKESETDEIKSKEPTDSNDKTTQNDPLAIEEEFELDQPITFVGVEEPDKPTNSPKKVHVVQKGETLYGIAKTYGVSVQELQRINQLGTDAGLWIGQELMVGDLKTSQKPAEMAVEPVEIHVVEEGETMYQIARQHQVTIKKIMEWNQKDDFSLSAGEELKIKR